MDDCRVDELEHTADWQLRLWAIDFEKLLICAATSMFELLDTRPDGPAGAWQQISVTADDPESLLVSWLGELLFVHDSTGQVPAEVELDVVQPMALKCRVRWAAGSRPRSQIEAVTYHDLEIREVGGGLQTTLTFDV